MGQPPSGDKVDQSEQSVRRIAAAIRRRFKRLTLPWRMFPSFLVIGAQRSGTTSLYEFLVRHHQIRRAFEKEVHFFDKRFHKGLDWYRMQFPIALGNAPSTTNRIITGEATPYYLFHPLVADRVQSVAPDIKIIVSLRNPIDRAYSHYHLEVRRGRETRNFEQAIDEERQLINGEDERIRQVDQYASSDHQNKSYLSRGHYAEQLSAWRSCFSEEQFCIVCAEEFYRQPDEVIGKIVRFLDLEPAEMPISTLKRYEKGSYNGLDERIRIALAEHFSVHNCNLFELIGEEFRWEN